MTTLLYELNTDILENGDVSRSRLSKKTDRQTDRQTDATDYIAMPYSRAVSNTNSAECNARRLVRKCLKSFKKTSETALFTDCIKIA